MFTPNTVTSSPRLIFLGLLLYSLGVFRLHDFSEELSVVNQSSQVHDVKVRWCQMLIEHKVFEI
jgi:hypothetical protein